MTTAKIIKKNLLTDAATLTTPLLLTVIATVVVPEGPSSTKYSVQSK